MKLLKTLCTITSHKRLSRRVTVVKLYKLYYIIDNMDYVCRQSQTRCLLCLKFFNFNNNGHSL